MLNLKRTTKTVVLSLLFLLPLNLSGQEHESVGSPNETAGSSSVAAFDFPWLAKYYGLAWCKCCGLAEMPAVREAAACAESSGTESSAPSDRRSPSSGEEYTLSLRANLLRWATLTPDLGLE